MMVCGFALALFAMDVSGQPALATNAVFATSSATDPTRSDGTQLTKPPLHSESAPLFHSFNSGPSHEKLIALTFDDGPHAVITPKLLDVLRAYKAKATFFVLGERVKLYPMILRQIFDEGHEIGNHTYSHRSLAALSTEEIEHEIIETQSLIKQATGYEPSLFRPPYGAFRSNTRPVFQKHNLNVIMWSVDSKDWSVRNENKIYDVVITHARSGSIVLFHDIHPAILDALPRILDTLVADGYQFITVSELCGLPPLAPLAPPATRLESLSVK